MYDLIEKTFFHSLTRKIVGNVLYLLLPAVLFIVMNIYYLGELEELAAGKAELVAEISTLKTYSWGIFAFAVASTAFIIFFMRHIFRRPIHRMIEVLSAIQNQDGDISATLPEFTHDEISTMAETYNNFSDSLKKIIAKSRNHSVQVALSATQLRKVLSEVKKSTTEQEEQAMQVLTSSHESTQAIDEVAGNTLKISESTSNNLEEIRNSSRELEKVLGQVRNISELASGFQQTVERLSQSSDTITEILSMVKRFSDQTNLLALNASIEAARAGEAGRGFAVVADEVRTLSQQVQDATSAIDENIGEMGLLVNDTKTNSKNILEYTQNTETFISDTNEQFNRMVHDFEDVNNQLTTISSALDELAYVNKESHSHVEKIAAISGEIKDEMDRSEVFSGELETATEETQELLSRFIIGYGNFENVIRTGRNWVNQIQEILERLNREGHNVFDTNYVRINEGLPEKFDVSYVDAYDVALRPVFDSYLNELPGLIYAIGVNTDGYAPAHHTKVSEPLTGNYDVDNLKSRNRRIFNGNRAEIRRASHTAPFLLQTFIRDTGEVLNDLSMPIYVDGKHWGSLIMGFTPDMLQDAKELS